MGLGKAVGLLGKRLHRSVKKRGVVATIRMALQPSTLKALQSGHVRGVDEFDAIHGTETATLQEAVEFSVTGESALFAKRYQPLMSRHIFAALDKVEGCERFTLVDIGSGKGKALMLAMERYPFAGFLGVEFVPELHETAVRNLKIFTGNRKVRWNLLCADACEFKIPDEPCVFLLGNPFDRPIMEKVAKRLIDHGAKWGGYIACIGAETYTQPFDAVLPLLERAENTIVYSLSPASPAA